MEQGNVAEELATQASRYLEGLDFPAPKKDVIGQAQKERASEALIGALEKIPEGVYSSADEVAEHLTGRHEGAVRKN